MSKNTQSDEPVRPVALRLPVTLMDQLRARAKKNRRSLSAELTTVVEEALEHESAKTSAPAH